MHLLRRDDTSRGVEAVVMKQAVYCNTVVFVCNEAT